MLRACVQMLAVLRATKGLSWWSSGLRASLVLTFSVHFDHFVARTQAIKGVLVGQADCGQVWS